MMRLRLRILRNELPAVNTLWPVSDTQQKNTIIQLLEQVNAIFPLEAETWGLEHYVVTVSSFECLHYHEIGAACKDEDEVVIRPLSYAEVRARTVLGRDQIAPDGRHLYDGLPYGRPLLRGVIRPDVRIPPMKRRRLENGEAPVENEGAMVLFGEYNSEEEEDSEDDEDFEMEDTEEMEDKGDGTEDETSEGSSSEDGASESDLNDTSEDTSTDESQSRSEESGDGANSQSPVGKAIGATGASQNPSSDAKSSGTRGSWSPLIKSSATKESAPKNVGIPYEGKAATRIRNARRRDTKHLQFLKRNGVLPSYASLETLHQWKSEQEGKARTNPLPAEAPGNARDHFNGSDEAAAVTEKDTSTETLGRSPDTVHGAVEAIGEDTEAPETVSNQAAKRFEEQRQELLARIASGGVDVTTASNLKRKASADESRIQHPMPDQERASPDALAGAVNSKAPSSTNMIPASVARRARLDLAGSKRMLFGSLGVRVPKTQDEKDALQKKLNDRARQRVAPPADPSISFLATSKTAEPVQAPETRAPENEDLDDDDEESWREKIKLTAVECCEEGISLSTPPFPFRQRWDPQQWRKKSKARTAKVYMQQSMKKAKKKQNGHSPFDAGYVETYDKYNQTGRSDALDYDDELVDDSNDEYWEDGTFIDGDEGEGDGDGDDADQQLRGEAAQQEVIEDGFPPLPADITSLPLLAEPDVQKNDFVVYTELVCSVITNWQPSMLTRTVQILGKKEDGFMVRMATRDLPPKVFGQDGVRIYNKFEMEGASDDEGEADGMKMLQWSEMVDPRLLARE
ncbi:hypothetical protein B0A50_00880 [Salinomyces thailandicus]|uniref:DUF7357 domain-containing protein n=1 Tax=Salinomyces thailandicus TaxID=706561 RepID=A0A4U0UDH5_9PEZI|nr:hypothetical protein B0A50_00880 [Salinomyces thailandica]